MDFTGNVTAFGKKAEIPSEAQIVWVSDLFVEDYVGGAELTSEALIETSPFTVYKLHSKDVTMQLLEQGQHKFWIFGNFASLDLNIIPAIVANMKYAIIEYDYKFCQHRSPEKHEKVTGEPCDCHEQMHGKLIAGFYRGARHLWWMSEGQQDLYFQKFPFLDSENINNTVLSSVFNDRTLSFIKNLRANTKEEERKGWVILGSDSWIKGYDDAKKYCEDNNLEYEVLWKESYDSALRKLASAKGHIYLPKGMDTCPRMVIEAKLLGCELILNDFVQHKDEEWFATDNIEEIEQYLYAAREWFWNGTKAAMEWNPTLSGYTTTKNCISQNYPFEASINSMLNFCDEVVVMDGGSDDGTWERLEEWAKEESKLKVYQEKVDWNHPHFAVFDGKLKDLARQKCSMQFCWQQDSDEVFHEDDGDKVKIIMTQFPSQFDLIALPVVEYWGGKNKVRCDINPWKWRISRNKSHIGHGIPKKFREYDESGDLYSLPGSDGCDYIHRETGEQIQFGNFYTMDVEIVRRNAQINQEALENYEKWFNLSVENIPSVFHYSWWNIERKIKTFKGYWGKHWKALYNLDVEDTAENNVMFDVPWSEVSDEMICEKAKELKEKTGGWIFHNKWNGQETKSISCSRSMPIFIKDWIEK